MPRRTLVVAVAFALAACGRIGFNDLSVGDANSGDAAFPAVVLASDDFGRSIASGWGSADLGGVWNVFNPNNSMLSVGSGHGSVTLANTMAEVDFHLTTATALDAETRAIVSFDRVPTTGSYFADVTVRWVSNVFYYELNLQVNPGGSIQPFIGLENGGSFTTLATATSPITVSANAGVELSLVAIGASPTTLCGKVWLEGTSEPSACTVSVQDNTANVQVPGISYLQTYDVGGAAPMVSFSTFRYLQIGPQ